LYIDIRASFTYLSILEGPYYNVLETQSAEGGVERMGLITWLWSTSVSYYYSLENNTLDLFIVRLVRTTLCTSVDVDKCLNQKNVCRVNIG